MSESFVAKITPLTRPDGGPVDPGYGVDEGVDPGYGVGGVVPPHAGHPLPLPPLPGVWPPPGKPSLPIQLPPGRVELPIYIQGTPELPIALPPGQIWPPLPPDKFPHDKTAILVWVVGVGTRWFIYDSGAVVAPPIAPTPQPKLGGR